jgi:hypothetical protein
MNLMQFADLPIYPRSVIDTDGVAYFLARSPEEKLLGIQGHVSGFDGLRAHQDAPLLCPLTPANAAALRERLPWLRPRPLGLDRSAGCGDRLGLATPGHVRAVRASGGVAPIFAQQSMRENERTGRTPQDVMDDAMWGVFQEGWREPWGADADHLKTVEDIDLCVAAGYTFFTFDPGDRVDNEAHTAPLVVLKGKVHALPWADLADSPGKLHERYLGHSFPVENLTLEFDEAALARAAAKYGWAIAHTAHMYRHLAAQAQSFELEVSVDETETPTSPQEHFFVASELRRLGVCWVSLAPRYIGRFEKGADYIGDLDRFEAELEVHAAIARTLGPYKLSLHSGSDKFSIYPYFARHAGDLAHLKTAGTSYLEALRTIAAVDPGFFRQILALAIQRYPSDRATYHVSAQLHRIPVPDTVEDAELPGVLDQFDAREALHVTFGSVLDRCGERLLAALDAHEEAHHAALEAHFRRHLAPFVASTP